ncbi:Mif2/CENP-C like-domain-containing protein [Mycena pura]|uniref:CENP-C homolog n=1 Tax=Mycena pura TaxID=153505 RepID=A0AAD6YQ61_9AGAR|nr:Mif2/CENP-C like-domain-containing protein [Mycena pura]
MARTPNKPHIPYRGDDPSVGKKTGIKVPRVARTFDGYERFNDLLNQATRTPPRRKRKSMSRARDGEQKDGEDDSESDGELSMELDSPVHYAAQRASRGAEIDFNGVSSPLKSTGHAGPSRLGPSLTAHQLLYQDEDEDDGGMDNDNYHREEDLSSGDMEETVAEKTKRSKGKGRALTPVYEADEDEMEDDIAHGLEDAELPQSEEDEEEPAPPKKKPRTPLKQPKPRQANNRQKENHASPEGVRRSKRVLYAPLEFWRGERVVYAPRKDDQPRQVPHIKEIVRLPKDDPVPRRPPSKRKRGRSRPSVTPVIEREVIVEIDASNPEAGWDDGSNPLAEVLDFRTGEEVSRRVAFTAKMFNPRPVKVSGPDDEWLFEKIFGDDNYMAAGQLVIPPKKRKPVKGTKDNTYIFFVVEGAVNVEVGVHSFVLATGGMFMVPRGNSYLIENIAERDSKLFFTQARKVPEGEEETEASTVRAS